MFLFSLIKSGKIHLASTKKVIPESEFSLAMSAHDLVQKAQEEREKLLEETHNECQQLRKQAEAQGFQKGLEQFNEQILHLENEMKIRRHEMQSHILPLVLKTCKRIIGEELKTNSETIINIIQQAIKPVVAHQHIKIYVNKLDLPNVHKNREALKAKFEKLETFVLAERGDVSEGSCIIETEVGIINATLENQWRALEAAFENYMKRRQ